MNIIPSEPTFVTYALTDSSTGLKRGDPEIRTSMLDIGAVLLQFDTPPDTRKESTEQWRTMESKGFHVSADGCIFPYRYFWSSNIRGHKLSGHRRSNSFFLHRVINSSASVNQYGWPTTEQVSHLCHRENCVNPQHLLVEPQWCNLRRNYCGLAGACSCGMQPACLLPYMKWDNYLTQIKEGTVKLATTENAVLAALQPLREQFKFVVLKKTHFVVEDRKRKNWADRKKKGKKHEQQHLANLQRKQGKEQVDDEHASSAPTPPPAKKFKLPVSSTVSL